MGSGIPRGGPGPRHSEQMSSTTGPAPQELGVSEARARLPELVEAAESGRSVYLTRHGRRVAAIVPADLPEQAARARVTAFARDFAGRHRALLDRLAE